MRSESGCMGIRECRQIEGTFDEYIGSKDRGEIDAGDCCW